MRIFKLFILTPKTIHIWLYLIKTFKNFDKEWRKKHSCLTFNLFQRMKRFVENIKIVKPWPRNPKAKTPKPPKKGLILKSYGPPTTPPPYNF